MQTSHVICPRCQSTLSDENKFEESLVCSCGWSASLSATKAEKRSMDRMCAQLVGLTLIAGSLTYFALTWGVDSFTVARIKTLSLINAASSAELGQLALICKEKVDLNCMESSYEKMKLLDPENKEVLALLAHVQKEKGRIEQALENYRNYFSRKGDDIDARHQFAKLLGQRGLVKEARQQFRQILQSRPDVLQTTVTRDYVNMLVENNRPKEAKKVILYYRKKGDHTGFFLQHELNQIDRKLASQG